ncbi:MAG TPA: hypothetical protein VMG38_21460 [Trebonia sp.]|nr:hypothetical protein [Trebonia sp.]
MMTSPPRPVYSKSNPAGGISLSPRQKRALLIIGVAIVVVAAAGIVWGALQSDSYQTSSNGCISVTIPGSIGGEFVHDCGDAAKAVCRAAYASRDPVSLAERPACEQAGLTPAKVAAG